MNLFIFYSKKTLLKIFPLYLFEMFIKLFYSIKYPRLFLSILKALVWTLFHFGFIIRKRREIQKQRKVGDEELIKLMSYKIFPEHINPKISNYLNSISRFYCKLFRIKTYDI